MGVDSGGRAPWFEPWPGQLQQWLQPSTSHLVVEQPLAQAWWLQQDQPSPRWDSHPACALQGIAARWLSAHYKTIARVIARAIARGLGFVTLCPNEQGKNAYFSKVSDASGTACDAVNVRKDCQHFGAPLWVVVVEERGPLGGPS